MMNHILDKCLGPCNGFMELNKITERMTEEATNMKAFKGFIKLFVC